MNRLDVAISNLESVMAQLSMIEGKSGDRFSLDFSFHTIERVIADLKLLRR